VAWRDDVFPLETRGEIAATGSERIIGIAIETEIGKIFFAGLLQTAGTADKVLPPDVTDPAP